MAQIDPELMQVLVCPLSHKPLIQVGDWLYSTDPATRRKYPIRDGLPIMLIDESVVAEPREFDTIMAGAEYGKAGGRRENPAADAPAGSGE